MCNRCWRSYTMWPSVPLWFMSPCSCRVRKWLGHAFLFPPHKWSVQPHSFRYMWNFREFILYNSKPHIAAFVSVPMLAHSKKFLSNLNQFSHYIAWKREYSEHHLVTLRLVFQLICTEFGYVLFSLCVCYGFLVKSSDLLFLIHRGCFDRHRNTKVIILTFHHRLHCTELIQERFTWFGII